MACIKYLMLFLYFDVLMYSCLPFGKDTSVDLDKEYPRLSETESQSMFPGVFLTQAEHEAQLTEIGSYREKYFKSKGQTLTSESYLQHDGDSCCPTHISHYINTTMENIHGNTRPIVHFPPMYQFIPHGSCVDSSTSKCDGKCLIEPMALSLLTWDSGQNTFVFELFMVPGYCSCKLAY